MLCRLRQLHNQFILFNDSVLKSQKIEKLYKALFKRYEQLPREEQQNLIVSRIACLRSFGVDRVVQKELCQTDLRRVRFAVIVARTCGLVEFIPELVALVSDETLEAAWRADVSYDLTWLTMIEKHESLKELVKIIPPECNIRAIETIKGNALRCLCPSFMSLEQVLPLLQYPIEKNYFGAYAAFLEYTLPNVLDEMLSLNNAANALAWASRHVAENEPFDRLGCLARDIFTRCWKWNTNEPVKVALVDCLVSCLKADKPGMPFVGRDDMRTGVSAKFGRQEYLRDQDSRIRVLEELVKRYHRENAHWPLDWLVGSYRDEPLVTEDDFEQIVGCIFIADSAIANILVRLVRDLIWKLDVEKHKELLGRLHMAFPDVQEFDVSYIRGKKEENHRWIERFETKKRQRDAEDSVKLVRYREWMHNALSSVCADMFPGFVHFFKSADGKQQIPPVDLRDTIGWSLLSEGERDNLRRSAESYLEKCDWSQDIDGLCVCCAARLVFDKDKGGNQTLLDLLRRGLFGALVRHAYLFEDDEVLDCLVRRLSKGRSEQEVLVDVFTDECGNGILSAFVRWHECLTVDSEMKLLQRLSKKPPEDLHFSRVLKEMSRRIGDAVEDYVSNFFDWNAKSPPELSNANRLRVAVEINPRKRLRSILKWFSIDAVWGRRWLETSLYCESSDGFAHSIVFEGQSGAIVQMMVFLDQNYPDQNSNRHKDEVTYSPDGVDKVYDLKLYVENFLVFEPTERSLDVLIHLSRLNPNSKWQKALKEARKRLEIKKEKDSISLIPVTMHELRLLLKPENSDKQIVYTSNSLMKFLMRVLHKYDVWLQTGGRYNKARKLWRAINANGILYWWPKEEAALSDDICEYIQQEARNLSAFREPFVGFYQHNGGKRRGFADLVVHAQDPKCVRVPAEVIIEVKGNWNRELKTNLKTQLVDHYLRKRRKSKGIFVCGCYNLPSRNTVKGFRTVKETDSNLHLQHKNLPRQEAIKVDVVALDCSIKGVLKEQIRKY